MKNNIEIKKESINERNYAIDILRIIAMLMIISLHFFSYNPAIKSISPFSIVGILKRILHSISAISVNCYILISGYYLIKFQFKLKKIMHIVAEVWIYSVLIYIILIFQGSAVYSIKNMIFAFIPTLTREYWFITSYIGAYIFSPILRNILNKMDKRTHAMAIIIGFLLFVVYYNFFFFCDNLNFGGSTGIVWFIYLYVCGNYIYKYDLSKLKMNIKNYILSIVLALGSQIPFLIIYVLSRKKIFLQGATIFDSVYNSIFVFISSILFFKIFVSLKIYIRSVLLKKIINLLTTGSLAVYLIHDNKYMRNYLWKNIAIEVNENIYFFVFYWFLVIIFIYIFCAIIDVFRQIIEKKIFKKIDKKIDYIEYRLRKILDILIERM